MSLKTLRKKIALTAVTALTAGLFTVVSVPVANAEIDADEMDIVSTSALLVCNVDTTKEVAYIPKTSAGVLIEANGATGAETAYIKVTGPGVITAVVAGTNGAVSAVSPTIADFTDLADNFGSPTESSLTVAPTGVGTIKVTIYSSSTSAAVDQLTIYSVESCGGDAYAASTSYYSIVSNTDAASASWTETVVDSSTAATVANADQGTIKVRLNDVYGNNLSTAGALISTVTGPCLVGLVAYNGSQVAGSGKTAVFSTTAVDAQVVVEQETAGVGGNCTVSTTWNGTLLGTKTFTMQGAPAAITVSDVTVGLAATSGNYGYYRVSVTDNAGNPLPSAAISADNTEANNAAALATGIIGAIQDNTSAATTSTAGSGYGKTAAVTAANITAAVGGAAGLTRFTCTAGKAGTAKVTVRTPVNSAATSYVTSAPFTVACGGTLSKWTISMDKATYQPGEIATLTVTGTDSLGAPVHSLQAMTGVVHAFGGMTAVTAPTSVDVFNSGAGIKTYQFSVGTTEGSYVGTFTVTGSTDTAAKTVQYKVASATPTVTNADVLKSIVSLIASINKQIQALQKLILKR
jgi:hypothetical protein